MFKKIRSFLVTCIGLILFIAGLLLLNSLSHPEGLLLVLPYLCIGLGLSLIHISVPLQRPSLPIPPTAAWGASAWRFLSCPSEKVRNGAPASYEFLAFPSSHPRIKDVYKRQA